METPAEIAHDHEHSTYFKGLEEGGRLGSDAQGHAVSV